MIPDSKKTVYFLKRHPRILAGFLVVFLVAGGLIYWKTAFGVTRTWDGGGVDGTCGGAGTANNWTCAANWSADTVPTSSDTVVFDATSTKDCTINSSLSGGSAPAGISINAGYSGTITQATGITISVGASGFTQAAGTFTGGNSAISSSIFTLSGGTFTSTTGTLTVTGNFTHTAGGTFTHNSGTVLFGSASPYTVDVTTTETFNNLTINNDNNGGGTTIASGDTLIVLGTFTDSTSQETIINTGTIEVRGNVVIGTNAMGGTATVTWLVSGDQSITGSGGRLPNMNVAKSGGSLLGSGNFGASSFSLSSGTFTSTTGTFTVKGNFTHTAGGTFTHNSGTVLFGSALPYTVDVTTTETFNNLTINNDNNGGGTTIASGDTLIVLGTFTDSTGQETIINTGTIEVRGNVVIGTSAIGGTATVTWLVSGDQSITGSGGRLPNMNVAKSGGSLLGSGNFGASSFSLSSGTFVSTTGTLTVTGNFTHTAGGTFTHNSGTVLFGSALPYTVDVTTTETFNNLTINNNNNGSGTTIASGDTLIVLGTFTDSTGQETIINTGTIEVRGNVVIGTSAFGGTATLSFTGPNDQTYTDNGGNEPNGNVTINKPVGAVVNLASNADWNSAGQTTTITSGILNLGAYNLYTGGTLTVGANGVLHDFSTGDLILGGTVVNSGIIRLESGGSCGSTDSISITSSVGATQRAWSGAGTYTLWDVSIQDQGGTANVQVNSGTSVSGNGTNFVFNSACNLANNTPSLTSGLVGYWPMEENTGTSTADISGNSNTGTLTNGPTWTTGQIGNSVNFDGSNDHIDAGSNASLNITGDLTLSAWIRRGTVPESAQNRMFIVKSSGGGSPHETYYFEVCGGLGCADGNMASGYYNGSSYPAHTTATPVITDTNWHHVVSTRTSSTITIYVDGVSVGSTAVTGTPVSGSGNLIVGGHFGSYNNYRRWNGTLDEVRIYNRALTATEVQQLYYNVRPSASSIPSGKFQIVNNKLKLP